MKNDMNYSSSEKNEFGQFAYFFIKYMNGSSTQKEAFIRARSTYRKLFKKIPYQSCTSFLMDYNKIQSLN